MRKAPFKALCMLLSVSMAAFPLSGCMPNLGPMVSHDNVKELFYGVVRGVQCEIRHAIKRQVENDPEKRLQWLRGWSALMNLNFNFTTTASFNPGVNFKTPMVPANLTLGDFATKATSVAQSYSLGVGGGVSGEGSLNETVKFFYPFNKDFFAQKDDLQSSCYKVGGVSVTGDLALNEWLEDVLEPVKRCAFLGYQVSAPAETVPIVDYSLGSPKENQYCKPEDVSRQGYSADNPIRVFQHEVRFSLTLSGGITPTWNLVRISSPLGGKNLFEVQRKDVSTLTITLGAPAGDFSRKDKKDVLHASGRYEPSFEMRNQDLIRQLGSEFRNASQ